MMTENTTCAVFSQQPSRFANVQQPLYPLGIMNFGQRLKLEREKRGLTQVQLAEMAGIKQQTIQAIESRNSKRSAHAVVLARALGLTTDDMLGGDPLTAEANAPAPPAPPPGLTTDELLEALMAELHGLDMAALENLLALARWLRAHQARARPRAIRGAA